MSNLANSYVKYVNHLEQINEAARSDPAGMIRQTEEAYHRYLRSIVTTVVGDIEHHKIILLSGPSSSGKTTTAEILKSYFEKSGVYCATISLDNFYRGESLAPLLSNGQHDYESVDALDLPRLEGCLLDLISTNHCDMPLFDFPNHRPSEETCHVELRDNGVAIFEGIHGLNPRVSMHLPQDRLLKLYISVKQDIKDKSGVVLSHNDLRFLRRTVRDHHFRSTPPVRTLNMWQNVLDGENKYIRPFKSGSDITINSIHIYEPCVIGSMAIPLLKTIDDSHPDIARVRGLIAALERFVPVDPSLVPPDSVLREFIGGSRYAE